MNQAGRKLWKKLPAAALASVFALGAGAASLPFAPSASAEEYAAVSAPNVSDPAKMELIYLVTASMDSQNRFAQTSDHMEYWALQAAQNQALAVVANPAPSSAQLFSARQQMEKAWGDYAYRYVHDKKDVSRIMGRDGSAIYSKYPSSDPSYLTPYEKGVIDMIDKTYDLMDTMGDSNGEAAQAYQYYELETSKLSHLVTPDFDRYRSSLAYSQEKAAESMVVLEQLGIDAKERVDDFNRSVAFLQALLSNGPYERAVYSAALNDVENDRYAIQSSAKLAQEIVRIQKLADTSPRGIRSGEYPASAFGTLNRAINEAKHVLETADSAEEMNYQYQFVLERAEYYFKKSVKP
ncbi:hypothetical protein [Saccharibacillus alkalitolerans]|uniref:DUF3829 domain-containing protein n=1 Tax=Saccharibacillus alkalitolerans TaxID=2705290 RepID=A0ABX0EZ92_9BACL|nr:hypothetical protein [Saccharibacillus alkalitolerans]NGZ74062.1 hypothetical protein [Saccharibacillus alkalitolerans]